ncbi:MerR family transcriptional regulator [Thermodesulfobacterium sp. TA1]|uniref:MerR family transcriptional regulator n=1 Tax=Thermodesulfobacterium sp. TA1 TaxID=2234087 RepID=UPI001231959B|nr:MerR family transcriptional regulator [Thermodesulfobacterium sp. TA1]QER41376.1 MerR family transcriptional regulator [Thermodesulfobacterium sp. TA1]
MKPKKESLYVPISEVAQLLNVKTHVLYYWEKKIPQLKPYKISNRKFYKKDQLELLFKVKKLVEEGYTLEGVKKSLSLKKLEQPALFNPKEIITQEKVLRKVIKEVLKELKDIYRSL